MRHEWYIDYPLWTLVYGAIGVGASWVIDLVQQALSED